MIEIEVDNGLNGDLLFHPVGERVRGLFLATNVRSEDIGKLVREVPRVPGQIIAFDEKTSTGFIHEPLQDPGNAAIREQIQKRTESRLGGKVEFPVSKEYPNAHAPTWLGHMRRCVHAGLAKVIKGDLPKEDPSDMKVGFYSPIRQADPKDAIIEKLMALLLIKLTPEEKKQLAPLLDKK